MSQSGKSWGSEILIGLIVTIVGGLILQWISPTWLSSSWQFIANLTSKAWIFLASSIAIPGWLLILLCGLSLIVVLAGIALGWLFLNSKSPTQPTGEPHALYTEDIIDNIRWRWKYPLRNDTDIGAFCPKCDLALRWGNYTYHCDECLLPYFADPESEPKLKYKVARIIERNIRTGEWRERIKSAKPKAGSSFSQTKEPIHIKAPSQDALDYHVTYRQDTFDDIKWQWSYSGDRVCDLLALCAKDGCLTELTFTERRDSSPRHVESKQVGTNVYCPSCKTIFPKASNHLTDDARRQIEASIRTGKWKIQCISSRLSS